MPPMPGSRSSCRRSAGATSTYELTLTTLGRVEEALTIQRALFEHPVEQRPCERADVPINLAWIVALAQLEKKSDAPPSLSSQSPVPDRADKISYPGG